MAPGLSCDPEAAGEEVSGEAAPAKNDEDERFAASANLECAVCLEVVLSKPRLADRRFGLLNACDHCFCLNCIRGWRQGGVQRGTEASASSNEQARMCPICRVNSHFITPTTIWPRNEEEKAAAIDAYVTRMSKIPCKHFDGGDGTCPFGTSCHYEHRYRATGELEDVQIRKSTASDGSLNILTPVRLSDFLSTSCRLR